MIRLGFKVLLIAFAIVVGYLFMCQILIWHNGSVYVLQNTCRSTTRQVESTGGMKQAKSASSGKTFSGNPVRKFPFNKRKFFTYSPASYKEQLPNDGPRCSKWAVVTTIFEAPETVHRFVKLTDWCLVVVFDKKTPRTYDTKWTQGEGNKIVVLLYPDNQEAMKNEFVNSLPWNTFGRKNVGYLYAIMHGADVIWDFDDDNLLKFWIPGAAPSNAPSIDSSIPQEEIIDILEPTGHDWPTYNPYPVLGAPTLPSWPRGLPPDDVKETKCSNTSIKSTKLYSNKIAVLQSLADYQPDVDAIFRITMPIPMWFDRKQETRPLIVPDGVFTPYNAQATLHFKAGFWGLYLPISVTGRVSDIWRSYIAKRLFWDAGLKMGFLPRPLVVQDRNVHNNVADLEAERDLYMKSKHLVEFLGQWEGKGKTMVERIEELWIEMYERTYIEYDDVILLQLWLQGLIDIGYKFPPVNENIPYIPQYPKLTEDSAKKRNSTCKVNSKRTFWTSDIHDGTRLDTPSTLASLGQSVIVAGFKKFRSFYPLVFKQEGITVYTNLSNIILRKYTSHSRRLTETMVKENFEYYKNDEKIAQTDAFICSFPASMCELWMPFNKTIVFLPAHRYNIGRCTKEEFNRLNEHLSILANSRNIFGALSYYDQQYLQHYTGIHPLPLYSSSLLYTSGNPYNPIREEIIVFARDSKYTDQNISFIGNIIGKSKKFDIVFAHTLYRHWNLSDLMKHRAIVLLPYSVMSYKLTEFYSLSIPLFIPSMLYFHQNGGLGSDRSVFSRHYCSNQISDEDMKPHHTSIHPYSPNNMTDKEAEYYWLQMSDFYRWPHITYFDNLTDLENKLEKVDFNAIHKLMVQENKKKFHSLVNTWCVAISKIETGRKVSSDYNQTLSTLYNTTNLQYYIK